MASAKQPDEDPSAAPVKKPRMTKRRRKMLLERLADRCGDPNGFDREALLALQDDAYGKRLPD